MKERNQLRGGAPIQSVTARGGSRLGGVVVSRGVPFKFKAKDLGDPGAHALTLTSFNLAQAFPQLADFTKDPSIPASDHLICTYYENVKWTCAFKHR